MPTKKKRFNARFPPARIKKIMQTDEEVGKVAAAVPVIISAAKALEMFMQSLVENASGFALSRNAKTMTTGHLKKCILSQQQFDFLKDLVEHIPDLPTNEEDTEGESKPKRRKVQPHDQEKKKRERKKAKPSTSDESEEELQSDEEDSGSSEGQGSNPSGSTTNIPQSSTVSSASAKHPDSRLDNVAPSYVPQFNQFSSVLSSAQDEEDDDYDA